MKIGVRKLLFVVILVCLFHGIIGVFIPNIPLVYLSDLSLILSLLLLVMKTSLVSQRVPFLWLSVILFFLVGTLSFLMNSGNFLHYLWGLRNYYRFFIFFFLCVHYFQRRDSEWCINLIIKSYVFHIMVTLIQFALGYRQDFLGGIWGIEAGSNGGLNIYLVALFCLIIRNYHQKKISSGQLIFYLGTMCINAALSELKFYFVEISILAIVYIVISKPSIRSLRMILGLITVIICGIYVMNIYFPAFSGFFTLDNLMMLMTNTDSTYSSAFDVGRLSVFTKLTPIIQNWSGKNSVWFGIGLGNADYSSSFRFLSSVFYYYYQHTNYTWFSLAYLFIETGYLGILSYLSFFVSIFLSSLSRFRRNKSEEYLLTILFSIGCMLLIFYNSSLRNNGAYLAFLVLSIPFIEKPR